MRVFLPVSSLTPSQVSNLQDTVTQEDITELFGDVGPLKRAKLVDVVSALRCETKPERSPDHHIRFPPDVLPRVLLRWCS